jgi:hypothetical protein
MQIKVMYKKYTDRNTGVGGIITIVRARCVLVSVVYVVYVCMYIYICMCMFMYKCIFLDCHYGQII